jgi:hypothetical protein
MYQESNYSDSYFYNSTVFNYPTIDDQKKLAKQIADTLEGSNPNTSKYHKKKQNVQTNRDGYDSEPPQSPGYYSSSDYYNRDEYEQEQERFDSYHREEQINQQNPISVNKYLYDESLPDVIKRSIAKASMTDPVRMVQAPESFKEQHYTEHVTHTQMPPKAAMSLAAALQTEGRGGRGAEIFQKRKAKSEKWVIDETNAKKPLGFAMPHPSQHQLAPQQAPVFVQHPQPQRFVEEEPKHIEPYQLTQQPSSNKNNNYPDFNAKARGWGGQGSYQLLYSFSINQYLKIFIL